MNHSISQELYVFCDAIRMGIVLAVLYDLVRIFRRVIPRGTVLVAVEDIIIWIIAALFVFNMIYNNNSGNLRGYIIIGIIIGITLYCISVSKYIVNISSKYMRLVLQKVIKTIKMISIRIKKEVTTRNEQSKSKKRKKIK